ncbi:hypothetical protein CBOM_05205 [Ceraceosorus bombacis]|uniref:Transmembrane protein n=1 Tax=Ceraceosorus bombacis TaxID=401625 RepID=A0A0P1BIT9_9BASI|nr:hypothetical protein CBOM_05205 [Ceraceosorus bombacis]
MASPNSHQLVSSGAESDILQLKKRGDVPAARRERMGVLSSGSASSAHLKVRSPAVDASQVTPLVQKQAHGGEVAHLEKRQSLGQPFTVTLAGTAYEGTFTTEETADPGYTSLCTDYPRASICEWSRGANPTAGKNDGGFTPNNSTEAPANIGGVANTNSSSASPFPASSDGSSSGNAILPGPAKPEGSSGTNSNNGGKSNTGATVGAAVGCLLGGLLIGALFALWFLRRRHRNRVAAMQRAHESDLARYSDKGTEGMTVLPYKSERPNNKALETARQRIKTLEAERNAASAFGDTLDKLSERELVDKLGSVNRRLEQTAMAISRAADHGNDVTASRLQSSGSLPKSVPSFARAALSSIVANNKTASLDNVLKHVVNAVLVEQLCQPFCFVGKASENDSFASLEVSVLRQFDQARAARWRVMAHAGLREASGDPQGRAAVRNTVQQAISALTDVLVWSGAESSRSAASAKANKELPRLEEAVKMLIALVIELKEKMSSANFAITSASGIASTFVLTVALGLQSTVATATQPKILLPAVSA